MNRSSAWLVIALMNLLLLGVASCDENPRSGQPAGDQIGVSPDLDDPQYAYYTMVTDETTGPQPEWDGTKPLPKSIQELSKVAFDSFVAAKSQPQTGWTINCIELKHVPVSGSPGHIFPPARKNRWYCEFHLTAPNTSNYKWWQNNATRYVFLDGTIIKPQRAKSPPDAEWLRGD